MVDVGFPQRRMGLSLREGPFLSPTRRGPTDRPARRINIYGGLICSMGDILHFTRRLRIPVMAVPTAAIYQ